MTDLYLGLGILALISYFSYEIGGSLARRVSPRAVDVLLVTTVLALILYVMALWNGIWLSRLLPFSNLIVLGNWFPPATAFLVGLAWYRREPRLGRVRKSAILGSLLAVAWFSAIEPLQGRPPECRDQWEGNVCLQTSKFTCSAACAATVLRAHGIRATEREMAELCLTRDGTNWQGLYRGLKRKTLGTEWDVEVFQGTLDDLRQQSGPVILSAMLPTSAANSYYDKEWGWIPGQSHSVVFLDFTEANLVRMGEPTVGTELWTLEELDCLWQGFGIRLVRRESADSIWVAALQAGVQPSSTELTRR